MKKICLLGMAALMSMSAFAQEALLKEAERAMKKGSTVIEVEKIITPAFSDPSTAKNAMTYFIPGKAGFNQYDDLFSKQQLNMLDAAGNAEKLKAIMKGYNYMMQALPLDTVVDEKGKVKTKYSKDIINVVAGHYNDFYGLGVEAYNDMQDYKLAYDLWEVYTSLPNNPSFAKAVKAPADSILCEVLFNQGIAAWQANDMPGALKAFINAKNKGYSDKNVYDFAISVASALNDDATLVEIAQEGYEKFGKEDSNYIGLIINNYINKKDYKKAMEQIDQAISTDPNNAEYYVIKGILKENDESGLDPTPDYAKAVEIAPNNSKALYNLGRMYFNRAAKIYEEAPAEGAAFNKVFNEDFKPVMLEAVGYFEKASEDTNEQNAGTVDDALRLLEQAYYMLNDDSNLKLTQQRMGK